MPTLLLLIASIALATHVLAQAQEKSRANVFRDGQNFLMEIWMKDVDYKYIDRIAALEVRWFFDDTKGQPIPCKRTSIRARRRSARLDPVVALFHPTNFISNLFKCGKITLEQTESAWKLTDGTGAKFVLSAKDEFATLEMDGRTGGGIGNIGLNSQQGIRIKLNGGWGESLYLLGDASKPGKAIPVPAPAPVIR